MNPVMNLMTTAIGKEILNPNAAEKSAMSIELITSTGLRPLESAIAPHTKL